MMTDTQPKKKSKALAKIKEAWDENPVGIVIIAAGLLTASAKFIDSVASYQSKRAYASRTRR